MDAKLINENKLEWNLGWNEEGWTDLNSKIVGIIEEINYWGKPFVEEGENFLEIWIPYLEFEELFNFPETLQQIQESKYWKELPGFSLSRLEFLELLTYDGIKGSLGNIYWEEDTSKDVEWRINKYFGDLEASGGLFLDLFDIPEGRILLKHGDYVTEKAIWDVLWEEVFIPGIISIKAHNYNINKDYWSFVWGELFVKQLKEEKRRFISKLKKNVVQWIQENIIHKLKILGYV
ncbi:hypothetical protein O181_083840 [Austropuccinia psidii MF-1]|uniref:Uncharacterized protein n=1 Tax=Austropuccinia psidii MF-1 TaxID=1389203 RepID=A0A9Q3FNZ2_9BASI|nr:hypothetical protein [Austropuccinia psidii MF-1]